MMLFSRSVYLIPDRSQFSIAFEVFVPLMLTTCAKHVFLKVIALDSSSPPQIDVASVQILIAGLGSSPAKFVDTSPVTVIVNKGSVNCKH